MENSWKHLNVLQKNIRSLAHNLKPVVMVQRNGITEQLIKSVDIALADHELIKVKFLDSKEEKKRTIRRNCESNQKYTCRHNWQYRQLLLSASARGNEEN